MSFVRRSIIRDYLAINLVTPASLLLIALIIADVEILPLTYVRLGLSLLIVGYAPGAYAIDLLNVGRNRFQTTLYAVGLSALFYMLYGLLMNVLYVGLNAPLRPFTDESILIVLGAIAVYSAATDYDPLEDRLGNIYRAARETPSPYLLGIGLIALSMLGSHYVNVGLGRHLIVIAFLAIGLSSAVLVFGTLDHDSVRVLLYSITFSVLVQDLARTPYLSRVGDTQVEYYFANLSLTHGFWAASLYSTKSTSLFLNAYYPIVKLISGIPLLEVIRFVYPVGFAFISLVLFEMYRSRFHPRLAVVTSLLYVFADQFFILLSHSTRTGFAFLFVSLFLLALVDENMAPSQRKTVSFLFLFPLVFIHYGTSIVVLVMIVAIYISARVIRWYNRAEPLSLNWQSQTVYLVFIFSWFLYAGAGRTYDILVFNLFLITRRIVQGRVSESTSAQIANKELPSLTSQLIRFEYLAIALIAALVVAVVGLRYLLKSRQSGRRPVTIDLPILGERIRLDHVDLLLPVGGMALLAASFVPTSIFRLNRLYMLATIFFLPHTVVGLGYAFERLPIRRLNGRGLLSVVVVFVLLLNSGMLGLLLFDGTTHQVTIDKNVIEDQGGDAKLFELYVNYYPPSDYRASMWLTDNRLPGSIVYGDGGPIRWLSYFSYAGYETGRPPGPFQYIEQGVDNSGYLYVSKFTTQISKNDGGWTEEAESEFELNEQIAQRERCTKIYDNGGSQVFTTSCRD